MSDTQATSEAPKFRDVEALDTPELRLKISALGLLRVDGPRAVQGGRQRAPLYWSVEEARGVRDWLIKAVPPAPPPLVSGKNFKPLLEATENLECLIRQLKSTQRADLGPGNLPWMHVALVAVKAALLPAEPSPAHTLAEAWRAAITLTHNICTQESDRINADDGPSEAMSALGEAARRIREWLEPSPEQLAELLEEHTGKPCQEPPTLLAGETPTHSEAVIQRHGDTLNQATTQESLYPQESARETLRSRSQSIRGDIAQCFADADISTAVRNLRHYFRARMEEASVPVTPTDEDVFAKVDSLAEVIAKMVPYPY
jgi:hypothetical protein